MIERHGFLLVEMAVAMFILMIAVGSMAGLLHDIVGIHHRVQAHVRAVAVLCDVAEHDDSLNPAVRRVAINPVKHNINSTVYVTHDITMHVPNMPGSPRSIIWRVTSYE